MDEAQRLAFFDAELAKAEKLLERRSVEGVSDALSTLIGLVRWFVDETRKTE